MKLEEVPRLIRTVRHLRPSQIAYRLYYTLERRVKLDLASARTAPAAIEIGAEARAGRFPEAPFFRHGEPTGPEAVALLEQGEFVHLNHRLKIGRSKPYWRLGAQSQDRLWIVTLHYHRWAYELAQVALEPGAKSKIAESLFQEYLLSWIQDCDIKVDGARDLAWNCYAIATRLEWWIRAVLALGLERVKAWPDFEPRFLASLWRQANYLYRHPEKDLLANHVLRDALGLAWAGRFLDGPVPAKWMAAAAEIAADQVREQVLADGAHFERSPMYHLHVMEDVAKLACLLPDPAARVMRQTWAAMAEYLRWTRHPDGLAPLFNDGAINSAPQPACMLDLAERMGCVIDPALPAGGKHFPQTGMVVWHGDPWTMFFDVGPIGPDHQPGHAHADTLSLELSFKGARLVVDPGVFGYDDNATRRYDRSTRAHNVVCLDGLDSSEVWHIFRVGRRAYPVDVRVELKGRGLSATAGHDGYDHLPGKPRHHRTIELEEGGPIRIVDEVRGAGRRHAEGGLLLAPGWKATAAAGGWLVEGDGGRLRIVVKGPAELTRFEEARPYHPEYGLEHMTTRLGWKVDFDPPLKVETILEPL